MSFNVAFVLSHNRREPGGCLQRANQTTLRSLPTLCVAVFSEDAPKWNRDTFSENAILHNKHLLILIADPIQISYVSVSNFTGNFLMHH